MKKKYQVVVVGGGPGGYVTAIRCAQLGFQTVCIDKRGTLGGTCLNVGCIPSKSLLYVSETYQTLKEKGEVMGLNAQTLSYDFDKIMVQKQEVVGSLVHSIGVLLKKHGIDRLEGSASFVSSTELVVKTATEELVTLAADHIILATGSEPVPLPFAPFDETRIVSSTGILAQSALPKQLVVIGGGIIGIEIASVYQRLGSQVTIVEMLDQICPGVEAGAGKMLLQLLTKQGLAFHLETKVQAIENTTPLKVHCKKGEKDFSLEASIVLVCVGRRPYHEGLNLQKAGIALDEKGFVCVNGCFQTTQKNIYAIGDLIAGPGLAHRASEEGIALANFLAGKPALVNYLAIPSVIYTYPEVASVGLTEQAAQSKGLELITGQTYFRGNPRARCSHSTEGYVKIIGEKNTSRLLGLHILGHHASELIAIGALAIEGGLTVEQIANTPFAHPTLSEAIKEAAQQALGRAIHG